MQPFHFRLYVIRPTLRALDLWSDSAENLLLGTAIVESRLTWLRQIGGGPARGVYQIEPATRRDVHDNVLRYDHRLRKKVQGFMTPEAPDEQLVTNLAYATAIARLCYWRHSDPLPPVGDAKAMAEYHKKLYNTKLGATRVDHSTPLFEEAIKSA